MNELRSGDLAVALIDATAEAVACLTAARPERVREREFEQHFATACAKSEAYPWDVAETQWRLQLDGWQGSVGPVDIGLTRANGRAVGLVELKWGGDALWNVAWDMAKLALALSEGHADFGVLCAGATESEWKARPLGAELFETRMWDADTFLVRYAREFAFWRTDVKNYPTELPEQWGGKVVAPTLLELDGQRWEVRTALIDPSEAERVRIEYCPTPKRRVGRRERSTAVPNLFLASAHWGLGGPAFDVEWDGTQLQYRGPDVSPRDDHVTVRPSEGAWEGFWVELDRLDAWAWLDWYEPEEVATDGYRWKVDIEVAGRRCQSAGYMEGPGGFILRSGHPRFSAAWHAFLHALADLLDGLSVDR